MPRISNSLIIAPALALLLFVTGCDHGVKRADALIKSGQFDKAKIVLDNAARKRRSPEVYAEYGALYAAQGCWLSAAYYYNEAARQAPNDPQIQLKFGILEAARGGSPSNTLHRASIAFKKIPSDPELMQLVAEAPVTPNQADQALRLLQRVPAETQSTPAFRSAIGLLWFKQGKTNIAEQEFKAALKSNEKFAPAWFGLANLALAAGDTNAVLNALKKRAEFSPPNSFAALRYPQVLLNLRGKDGIEEARRFVTDQTRKAPQFAPAWLLLAQLETSRDKMVADLDTALSIDAYSDAAYKMRGEVYITLGRTNNAIVNFETMAKAFPGSPEARLTLARAQAAYGQVPAAFDNINKALAMPGASNYVDAILLRASMNLARSNSEPELGPLQKIVANTNYFLPSARLLLAEAYFQQGQTQKAQSLIVSTDKIVGTNLQWQAECARVLAKYNFLVESARRYTNLAQMFPTNIAVLNSTAAVLQRLGWTNELRSLYAKNLDLQPGSLEAIQLATGVDLKQGRSAEAEARVREQIAKQPSAELWLLMASIQEYKANEAFLNSDLVKAYRASPSGKSVPVLTNVPQAVAELKSAETAFRKAVETDPQSIQAQLALASFLRQSGRPREALPILTPLTASTNVAVRGQVWYEIGQLQETLKAYQESADAYLKAVEIFTNSPAALNNLAWLYADRFNRLDQAQEFAQRAYKLWPTNPHVGDTLGWVLYKRGDYPGARRLLLDSTPTPQLSTEPDAWFHLGMAHYMLGADRDAKTALNSALRAAVQFNKEFPERPEAETVLKILDIDPQSATSDDVSLLRERVSKHNKDVIALIRLAAIEEKTGDLDGALKHYENVITLSPNNAQALARAARLCSKRPADSPKALDYAKRARNLDPTDPAIAFILGRLVYETGDYRWASTLLTEAIRSQTFSSDPGALFDYATACYSVGQTQAAQDALQRALGVSSGFDKAEAARSFLACTFASTNTASAQQALPEAQKRLAANPNDLPALFVQARALEGRPKEASDAYARLLSKYPLFAPAARNLALLSLRDSADPQKTLDYALKAREAFPQDPELLAVIEISRYRLKQKPDQNQLQRLVAAGLPDDLKREVQNILSGLKTAAKK